MHITFFLSALPHDLVLSFIVELSAYFKTIFNFAFFALPNIFLRLLLRLEHKAQAIIDFSPL